jgi:hypothetical protein
MSTAVAMQQFTFSTRAIRLSAAATEESVPATIVTDVDNGAPIRTITDVDWSLAASGAALMERLFSLHEYVCMEQLRHHTSVASMLKSLQEKGVTLDRYKFDAVRSIPLQTALRIDGYRKWRGYSSVALGMDKWEWMIRELSPETRPNHYSALMIRLPVYHAQTRFWVPFHDDSICRGYQTVLLTEFRAQEQVFRLQNHWGPEWVDKGCTFFEQSDLSSVLEMWSVWANVEARMATARHLLRRPLPVSSKQEEIQAQAESRLWSNPLQVLLAVAEEWKDQCDGIHGRTGYQYILLAVIVLTIVLFSFLVQKDRMVYLKRYARHHKRVERENAEREEHEQRNDTQHQRKQHQQHQHEKQPATGSLTASEQIASALPTR